MVGSILFLLVLLVGSMFIYKSYVEKGTAELRSTVKQDTVAKKLKVESVICTQDDKWFRVASTIKNTSDTPVSSINMRLFINSAGDIFDSRIVNISQVIGPGKSITIDNTFDYVVREIPQGIEAEAEIINLKVPAEVFYTIEPLLFN